MLLLEARAQQLTASDLAPQDWREWLALLFPRYVIHPFAQRHEEFWEWVWPIQRSDTPPPFVAIWPRGGAKTTSAELATAALGVRGARRYAWYINETQDKADKNIANIASLLESDGVARFYPAHSERKLSKYGHSKGWNTQRLRTAGGFTVDAIGLDTAARGLKVEDQRPDLIVLDDIDGKHDSLATTTKKIETITTSILPAGSSNVAVLAVQNLIIPDGVFTRLADGRADFLADRIVSGPHPAVHDLEYEMRRDDKGIRRAVITGGMASWEGQSLTTCQQIIKRAGLSAFLKECQHMVRELAEGLALDFDESRHLQTWNGPDLREVIQRQRWAMFGGIDFGAWRFAFLLFAVDRAQRIHVIEEVFSQRERLEVRAAKVARLLKHYGAPAEINIWGDSANQTDIMEINAAFERLGEPYMVVPTLGDGKMRATSVERLNDMLGADALVLNRDIGDGQAWNLGRSASSEGEAMTGSRLLWEIKHWSYPDPVEGKAQKQDPDDNTADGADCIAALRYGTMSWWEATGYELPAAHEKFFPGTAEWHEHQERPKILGPVVTKPGKGSRLSQTPDIPGLGGYY